MEIFTLLGLVWAMWILMNIWTFSRRVDREHEFLKERADRTVRIVKLEPLDKEQTILAYDAETEAFLGQGKNIDEIKTNIMARFPEKIFILDKIVFSALPKNDEAKYEISNTR